MPMKQMAESLNLSKTPQHGLTKNAGVTKKEQTVMAAADLQMVERPSYTQQELMPAVEYLRTNAALSKSMGNLQIPDEIREFLPADLLNEAVNRIKREHKWNTIPTPAAIRDKISRQLIDRKLLQIQCRIAARNI